MKGRRRSAFFTSAARVLVAISVLVCLGAASLGVRSYWRGDAMVLYVGRPIPNDAYNLYWWKPNVLVVDSESGRVRVMLQRTQGGGHAVGYGSWPSSTGRAPWDPHPWLGVMEPMPGSHWGRFGFAWIEGSTLGFAYFPVRGAAVPHWLIVPLAAIPPAWWFRRHRRTVVSARRGLCRACGYDRRGTAPIAACPECGEVGRGPASPGGRTTATAASPGGAHAKR